MSIEKVPFEQPAETPAEAPPEVVPEREVDQTFDPRFEALIIRDVIQRPSDACDAILARSYDFLRKPVPLWGIPDIDQLEEMREDLIAEQPWCIQAIDVLLAELFARRRFGATILGITPTLLVGPPGTGKTRLCRRISDKLEAPSLAINVAGMGDNKVLRGSARGWAGNRPSKIVEFIRQTRCGNPLFLIDEIDKTALTTMNSGSCQEALLDLVQPLNACRYMDSFLLVECDLSQCMYVLTANTLSTISAPLLSRLSLAYVPAPGPEHAPVILLGVLRDLERTWRLPEGVLELSRSESYDLIGLSPREMQRAVMAIFGSPGAKQRLTWH